MQHLIRQLRDRHLRRIHIHGHGRTLHAGQIPQFEQARFDMQPQKSVAHAGVFVQASRHIRRDRQRFLNKPLVHTIVRMDLEQEFRWTRHLVDQAAVHFKYLGLRSGGQGRPAAQRVLRRGRGRLGCGQCVDHGRLK